MASQLANILTNYGNNVASQSGSGIAQGVVQGTANYIQGKQAQAENALKQAKNAREQTEYDQGQQDKVKQELFGIVSAVKTPQQWKEWQAHGAIPNSLTYENREPFIMAMMNEHALKAGTAGKTTEVGDPTSATGTRIVREMDAAGMPGKPVKSLVNIENTQEKEESKAYGKTLVEGYNGIRDDARNATTALQQYEMAKNIDIQSSGPLEAWKTSGIALAASLGVDPAAIGLDRADNAMAYQGIMQNMVLAKMQAQKGPQTENDAKRIERTLATLGNTEGARKFLLDAGMALENEKIDKHDFWMKWRDTHNGTFDGAEQAWGKFKEKTPFLAKNPKTGRPVFFRDFVKQTQSLNPGAEYSDIVDLWQKKYAQSN